MAYTHPNNTRAKIEAAAKKTEVKPSMVVREVRDMDRARQVAAIVSKRFFGVLENIASIQQPGGRVKIFAEKKSGRFSVAAYSAIQTFAEGADAAIESIEGKF
jgi:hypothetical protein